MRIHHLTAGYFRPPLRGLTQGGAGNPFGRGRYVIHCLLLELEDRLVLVDTGLGGADMDWLTFRLGPGMAWFGGASRGVPLIEQLEDLRHTDAISKSVNVTDIILTHLDKDHTGGLADFPTARVHVNALEHVAWKNPPLPAMGQRYSGRHLAHGPVWVNYAEFADDWFAFASTKVDGLPEAIRLVALPGHTLGHCGVAIELNGRWMLHCGDTVYHSAWLNGGRPPQAIQATERLLAQDWQAWNETRLKVATLVTAGEVRVFGSHDPEMFAELTNAFTPSA